MIKTKKLRQKIRQKNIIKGIKENNNGFNDIDKEASEIIKELSLDFSGFLVKKKYRNSQELRYIAR